MKLRILKYEHIFTPEKYFPQCHASTLLKLENGEILSSWFAGTRESHQDVAIWYSRRKENKWSNPVKVADEEDIPCWNPVLFSDEKGIIYLFYKVGENPRSWHTKYITSDNGGNLWSQPEELIEGDIGGRGPVKNKPIILSDGTWLAPASIEKYTHWDAFVDITRDEGKTWFKSGVIPLNHEKLKGKGVIQPTLWESEPGKVHMLLRSTEGFVYRSDSNDYGLTWNEAYATKLPNNNSGIDLIKLEDGNLVLVYNPIDVNWGARTPIVCSVSEDNGQTWGDYYILDHTDNPMGKNKNELSYQTIISAEKPEFSYPAIISYKNHVFITYTWHRRTIAYCELEIE